MAAKEAVEVEAEYPVDVFVSESSNPKRSMYAIYAYIDPPNHPNVGIYAIHGVSGNVFFKNR